MSWIAKFYMDGNCKENVGFAARRVFTIVAAGKDNGCRDLSQVTWDGDGNTTSPNNEISSARVMPGPIF